MKAYLLGPLAELAPDLDQIPDLKNLLLQD
jgi:hypothetical protein